MVSLYPISQEYNLTYTFDDDSESDCYNIIKKNDDDTVGCYLENSKDFRLFNKILKKTNIYNKLYSIQFKHTLFAVPDSELIKKYPLCFFENMDKNTAINIVKFSILNNIISKKTLESSPISMFITMNKYNKLSVINSNNSTILNKNSKIIHFNHPQSNGIIHIVDDLLIPSNFI